MKAEKREIPIARPATGEEEWQALREVLMSGWLTQGPKVQAFEEAFAERHDVRHAIATSNATTGLHLALLSLGVAEGDEVIVPAFTWISTANAVVYCGATPVFVDIDPVTFNLDPSKVADAVTERTRAIMPVHLFGLCADVDAIAEAAPGVPLVEDAACASGAEYKGRSAGSLGELGVFSFHPRKSITTGEGGMVTTNDEALAETVRCLRNHGASVSEEVRHRGPKPYILPEFKMVGYNYRMTDMQGAVGLVQLGKLDGLLAERQQMAERYREELSGIGWIQTPEVPAGWQHGWQAFVCRIDERKSPISRNKMMEHLQDRGISTRPGTHAVHMQSCYRNAFGLSAEDFPAARDADRFSMAIPMHNAMSEQDVGYLLEALKGIG